MRAVFITILAILATPSGLLAQDRPAPRDKAEAAAAKAREDRLQDLKARVEDHGDQGSAYRGDHDVKAAAAEAAAAPGMTIGGNEDDDPKQPLSCWDRPGGCTTSPLCAPPKVWNAQKALCVMPVPK